MTLKEIRKLFVQHTGRYDLVVDDTSYEDDGADFFIQQGQKVLDDLLQFPKSEAVYNRVLLPGANIIRISNCRAVKKIWIDDGESVSYITKRDLTYLRDNYGIDAIPTEASDASSIFNFGDTDQFFGESDLFFMDISSTLTLGAGVPKDYGVLIIRNSNPTITEIRDKGILILPPADKEYNVHIEGLFYSDGLVRDDDESWWSLVYPMTLIQAAMYALERFYRNSQGMQDHMKAIMEDVSNIDKNTVEEDIANADQQNDSWNMP